MSDTAFINELVRRAAEHATACALDGHPMTLQWVPPQSASSDPYGTFLYTPRKEPR